MGYLWRLDKQFALQLPHEISGTAVVKQEPLGRIPTTYSEVLLSIDTKLSAPAVKEAGRREEAEQFITSPMDGLLYLSSSPDSPAFVRIGDQVTPSQTVSLI